MSGKIQIEVPKDKIAEFCRKWKIVELALFGSVLRKNCRPDSDVDVLVTFSPEARHSLFDLMDMQEELSRLLGRKADLVEKQGLRNPFRRYEILRSHRIILGGTP
jgi:predicted nucleotidyltransferase